MANRALHLFAHAEHNPNRRALIFEGRTFSFGDLADHAREMAGGLQRIGVGRGSRVGIMIPSSPAFIIAQQALFALGAIVTPLNTYYRAPELGHAIESCTLEFLVMPRDLLDRVPSGRGCLRQVILLDGGEGDSAQGTALLADAMRSSEPLAMLAPVEPDDEAMLLLTSATTGKSKGVVLTAANLAANYDRAPSWLGITADAVILCALPLYNTFGLNQCINAMLVTGATMVLLPRFDADRCIEALRYHRCTFLPAVPTMLRKLIDHPDTQQALASVTRIMTGGAPVPAALLSRVLAIVPEVTVLTGYGLTEGTALITLTDVTFDAKGELARGRTIGRVLDDMTLGIIDEDGALLGPDSIGEIVIRGPNLMSHYHLAPEDTAIALAGGWLHSGDLGYLDRDGYAFIVDRKKDVIIRGGQNIYPAEVEEVLYQEPAVAEAAVIGRPDDVMGEVPIAFVSLVPEASVSPTMLLGRCQAALAPYKVPLDVAILADLPKGPTGKILRRALRPVASVK